MFADGKPGSGGLERLIARHDGRVCCVIVDGHVEAMPLEEAQKPEHWTVQSFFTVTVTSSATAGHSIV